ncbi:putative reverse transcriptase domain-containing protein [Tanacetum coccineum]|uniref:Reverse transcriptase domain-containing protein n=1 Tax=Tanacetum coccineum TaxID=301880 RepID=A0ABQ4ZFS8_9ASTR
MEWKTKVTTNDGIVIKFPGKFRGYKLAMEEEVEENEGLKEEFDGKGGAVVLTCWIEKMESVFDNCGCIVNQRMRYVASCFVNKALTWWNTQVQARGREAAIGSNHVAYTNKFHELAKLVPHLVTLESSCIKRYINGLAPQIYGTLTKGNDKRKEIKESSKQGSTWKDNKKPKTGQGFMATVPPRNDNVSTYSKCVRCYTYHPGNEPCKLCFNCQRPGHFTRNCQAPIRQVASVNAVRMGQNQKACYECGSLDHLRYDCPKWKQATGQARNPLALEGNKNTRNNEN